MNMLQSTQQELCYLTVEAFLFIYMLQEHGIEDFDLALEITRRTLGDGAVYAL
jgi:hypothetical protein